ncbi:hypothetical protein PG995_005635 [Apiospora arundinis]
MSKLFEILTLTLATIESVAASLNKMRANNDAKGAFLMPFLYSYTPNRTNRCNVHFNVTDASNVTYEDVVECRVNWEPCYDVSKGWIDPPTIGAEHAGPCYRNGVLVDDYRWWFSEWQSYRNFSLHLVSAATQTQGPDAEKGAGTTSQAILEHAAETGMLNNETVPRDGYHEWCLMDGMCTMEYWNLTNPMVFGFTE